MNLQENVHNAVHKKSFIFSNRISILNALFNSSKYKQNSLIYNMQLET